MFAIAVPMKDVFLCHASGDKEAFVVPFARALEAAGISYWLDDGEIKWGAQISAEINKGLNSSRFVVVFITPAFIGRNWTETELWAALSRENTEGRTVVLPIIVGDPARLLASYPLLHGKSYRKWLDTPAILANDLANLLKESTDQYSERLRSIVIDRWSGKRRVAETMSTLLNKPRSEISDFVRLELAIHEFARLRQVNSLPTIRRLHSAAIEERLTHRGLSILESMCLLATSDMDAAAASLSASLLEIEVEQQRHYLALQEGVVWLGLRRRDRAELAWKMITGNPPRVDKGLYPFGVSAWDWARALLAVIASKGDVPNIVSKLPTRDQRGMAHLTAVTARCVRRSRTVIDQIIEWSSDENWAVRFDRRVLTERLHSFEKDVLSVSGSLFGPGTAQVA